MLVQPLWPVQAAGDAEVHENTVQVRAVWGYGHGLVQGDIAADSYHLTANGREMADLQIPSKPYAYHLQS